MGARRIGSPNPVPIRDVDHEARLGAFLGLWGPSVPAVAGDAVPPDFASQCEAMLEARPTVISSVVGLYPPALIERMRARGIVWFANVSTVAEVRAVEAAGADAVVVQGSEASGHRGCFDSSDSERRMVGPVSLVPTVVDAVRIPVVATGAIAGGRSVAAALALGARAAQIGTGFLRCPEARIAPA